MIVDHLNVSTIFEVLDRQRNRETAVGDFDCCELQPLAQTNQRPRAMGGQVDQETKIVPHKEVYLPPRIIDIHQNKLTQWIFVAFGLGLTDSRELKVKLKFLKHPTRPSTSGHFEKEICRSQRQRPPRRHRPWQKRLRHHRGRWQKMTMLRQRLGNKRVTSSSSSLT